MKIGVVFVTVLAIVAMLMTGCATPAGPGPAPAPSTPGAPAPTPGSPVPAPAPTPAPTGESVNFRLLISDEANAIIDFQSLNVTISRIGVHRAGEEDDGWIEAIPEVEVVDLTLLQGDNATEIWSGNLTDGEYNKVFIYVDNVTGILASSNQTVNVKLPSGKLQISKPFEVIDGSVTNFVYDITVVKAGNSGKYILKPQIGDSGANQNFNEVAPSGVTERHEEKNKEKNEEKHGKPDKAGKPGEEEGQIEWFEGVITAISEGEENASPWTMTLEGVEGDVTVYVAELEGTPLVGAEAEVEGILTDNIIEDAKAEIEDD